MSEAYPVKYRLHLEPDLDRFRFDGRVEILMEAEGPMGQIALDAAGLAVWCCKTIEKGEEVECPFSVDPKKEKICVFLPKEMSGSICLRIDYSGVINDRMIGFYKSRYRMGDRDKYAAVTQFEESDARRALPCLDHPAKKAAFEVEMVVPQDLTAISNGPVVEEKAMEGGRKLVRFMETPKMSTYLLFFGVGEFEFAEDRSGTVSVRVAAMPGMVKYGAYSLEFGRKALEFSEDYYGVKYPLPKLDLIAISDFAMGAMENWGAITFRENLLLHDPQKTSRAGEERICEVIAHEIAHQWFGNLVTPSDWKYLWLNESFATYFGYGVVDHYYPEWGLWDQFIHSQTYVALERDALHETFPIEIPGGEHVVINSSTAPIIYNKGGSVLKQVEGYVGKEAFKEGLRRYLKRYQYGTASSANLWEALAEASSKPVARLMKSWVEQAGYPLLDVERDGDRLVVVQRRFTYLPNDSEQEWLIPFALQVFLKTGETQDVTGLLEGRKSFIDIPPATVAYKLNQGQAGFFRVRYKEQENLRELGSRVMDKTLSPQDRWGIQDELYAQVKKGEIPLDAYLDFLAYYSEEDGFLPLMGIADRLFHAYLVMEGERKGRAATVGRRLFEKALGLIHYEPMPGESHPTSILREVLLWHSLLYGSRETEEFSIEKFSSLVKGKGVHPDLMRSVMQAGAWQGNEEAFGWFDKTLQTSESEHERMNVLMALGCFRDEAMIRKVQEYVLEKVPERNKFISVGSLAANPFAIPSLWKWYLSALEEFERFHPVHYERVITAIVPLGGIGHEEDVTRFFEEHMEKKDLARDTIRLSLERLRINSRLRGS